METIRAVRLRQLPASVRRYTPPILFMAALLATWEFTGRVQPILTSYPVAVFSQFMDPDFLSLSLLPAFVSTVTSAGVGFGAAIILGAVTGYVMGGSRWAETVIGPYINAAYSTPRITLIPLLMLWFGVDFRLRVVVVFLSSVFPIIVNTYQGVKEVPDRYKDLAAVAGAGRWTEWRTVTFPSSIPFLLAGLHVGVLRALTGAIAAEMLAAITGTGRLLLEAGRYFQTDRLFAILIVLGILGWMATRLVDLLGWLYLRGRPI